MKMKRFLGSLAAGFFAVPCIGGFFATIAFAMAMQPVGAIVFGAVFLTSCAGIFFADVWCEGINPVTGGLSGFATICMIPAANALFSGTMPPSAENTFTKDRNAIVQTFNDSGKNAASLQKTGAALKAAVQKIESAPRV